MKRLALVAAVLLLSLTAGGDAMARKLSDLTWEKRVVIVFAGDRGKLEQQAGALLRDEAALAERDMLVLTVAGGDVRAVYGTAPSGESAESLRQRFGIAEDDPFTVVLIGKDGTEKWRAREPAAPEEINRIVDSMPMRRSGR